MSAYICDFREAFFADLFASGNSGAIPCPNQPNGTKSSFNFQGNSTRGEIGIIANVFERTNGASISYDPADANKNGRVVFYSEDVRETGQLLNLSRLPVFGPKTYTGKPFFMTFSILEFDNEENERFRALLKTLANVGSTSYPPSAPVLGVLNSLGGALLSGNQNDTEFRYHMEFDPPNTVSKLQTDAGLAEGYYVFVREERRDIDTSWDDLIYDEFTGWLRIGNTNYRNRSWFVIRVRRENPETAIDQDVGELLSEFVQRREEYNRTNITAVTTELMSLITVIEQTRFDNTAKGRVAFLQTKKGTPAAKKNAKDNLAKQLCDAQQSLNAQTPPPKLSSVQLDRLVDLVNGSAVASSLIVSSDLADQNCLAKVAAKLQ